MRLLAALSALLLVLTGCTSSPGDPTSSGTPSDAGEGAPVPEGAEAAGGDVDEGAAGSDPGTPADHHDAAADIVAGFDDAQLAGSVIVGSYDGTDPAGGAALVAEHSLAGVIVMAYNLSDQPEPDEVRTATEALAGAAPDRGWPVFIGVDQEGGPVSRLGTAALSLPPLMAHGAADDADVTRDVAAAQGADLRGLGFTADFAPVADVTTDSGDPAINVRSAGSDPELVGRTASAAIEGYRQSGIASSAKHFPGHGALTEDSHEVLPVADDPIEDMSDRDLVPFVDAVESGVPMVMMGHIGLPGAESTPATLNPDAYGELRDILDYDGVVVTDALNMGAVEAGPAGQETVEAIASGADLALLPPDASASAQALQDALADGSLDRDRLVEASERVVAMQLWQEAAGAAAPAADDAGEQAEEDVRHLGEASLTALAGECAYDDPADSVAVTGDAEAVAAFTAAAGTQGLAVDPGAETTVAVGSGSGAGGADVALATGSPWSAASSGADTVLLTYGAYPGGYEAAVRYLRGEIDAEGTLPVDVEGMDPPDCG